MELIAVILLAAVALNAGLIVSSKVYLRNNEEPAPPRTDEKALK